VSDDGPSDAELEALGLYDPSSPQADVQLELIHYLISIGATRDDLVEYRDELPVLGTVVMARPGRPRYTSEEILAKTGMTRELLTRLWRAAGLPELADDVVAFSDTDLEMLQLIRAAQTLFGEDAVTQLTRVIGSSLARIADAAVSSFLVNIEVPIVATESPGLAIAKANVAAASLLPGLSQAMDVLLRHHILAARRSLLAWQVTESAGFEIQSLAVGFVDLVGSTALAQRLATRELGVALSDFETGVADTVVAHRGRVVKLIGDEVMFVAPDPFAACEIALEVAAAFSAHAVLPPVRAGIAWGEVLTRDGDYFGPVVNLAARVVKEAAPGCVAADTAIADAVRDRFTVSPLGSRRLKGLDQEVTLYGLERA